MAGWRADWQAIHLPLLAGCAWLGTDADWLAGFGRNQDVEPTGAIERDLAPLPAQETWLLCPACEILVRWGAPLSRETKGGFLKGGWWIETLFFKFYVPYHPVWIFRYPQAWTLACVVI